MKKTLLFIFSIFSLAVVAQLNTTTANQLLTARGNGFSRSTFNGIDPSKNGNTSEGFANLTYNGRMPAYRPVRFYADSSAYEPTLRTVLRLKRTKSVQAVQAILALKPGMKIMLISLSWPGPQPGRVRRWL